MELETFIRTVVSLREKLLVYASKIAYNQIEAEDIVQDVLLKLWSIRDTLDQYNSVEALALKMTKNKTLDELKRHRNESIEVIEVQSFHADFASPDPVTLLEQQDMVMHVKRLIGMLPSVQQTIIRMKDVEGYELSEIAAITGASAESIRNNLSRARKRIREQLIKITK